jgi:hypothetical protein
VAISASEIEKTDKLISGRSPAVSEETLFHRNGAKGTKETKKRWTTNHVPAKPVLSMSKGRKERKGKTKKSRIDKTTERTEYAEKGKRQLSVEAALTSF